MSTAVERPRASLARVEMSVEEFLALPEDGVHRELIQGTVREERDILDGLERGILVTVRNRFHSRIEADSGTSWRLVGDTTRASR